MENVYENMSKYGERMEGKFSHKPHENGIVISVTVLPTIFWTTP